MPPIPAMVWCLRRCTLWAEPYFCWFKSHYGISLALRYWLFLFDLLYSSHKWPCVTWNSRKAKNKENAKNKWHRNKCTLSKKAWIFGLNFLLWIFSERLAGKSFPINYKFVDLFTCYNIALGRKTFTRQPFGEDRTPPFVSFSIFRILAVFFICFCTVFTFPVLSSFTWLLYKSAKRDKK